jgi:hypothetical protein
MDSAGSLVGTHCKNSDWPGYKEDDDFSNPESPPSRSDPSHPGLHPYGYLGSKLNRPTSQQHRHCSGFERLAIAYNR